MVDVFAWKTTTKVDDGDLRQAIIELNEDAEKLDNVYGFAWDKLLADINRRSTQLADVIPDEQRKAAYIWVDQVVYGH